MMMRTTILLVFVSLVLLFACRQAPADQSATSTTAIDSTNHLVIAAALNLLYHTADYNTPDLPPYLKALGVQRAQVDSRKATIGRVLFYDKQLSRDGKISCASCHNPNHGFANRTEVSTGVNGRKTLRNSPSLANVVHVGTHYSNTDNVDAPFFWDARAMSIAEQSKETFQNPDEMNMPLSLLKVIVENEPYYKALFENTYADQTITSDRIVECLESFVSSIYSVNSKFDSCYNQSVGEMVYVSPNLSVPLDTIVKQGNRTPHLVGKLPIKGFTDSEQAGAALFFRNCGSCHNPIMPYQTEFMANIGRGNLGGDHGIGSRTGNQKEMGVFKVPSLRNIEFTGPFFHDGLYYDLTGILLHYSQGVCVQPNVHPLLLHQNGQPKQFWLSAEDHTAFRDFLLTLSDDSYAHDNRFSNPFK